MRGGQTPANSSPEIFTECGDRDVRAGGARVPPYEAPEQAGAWIRRRLRARVEGGRSRCVARSSEHSSLSLRELRALRAALKQNVGRGVAPGHETPGTAILRQGAG